MFALLCVYIFISSFHTYVLIQVLSRTQSYSHSLNYICHWDAPFSHSIPFPVSVVEQTCPEYDMRGNTEGLGDNSFFVGYLVLCYSNLLYFLHFDQEWFLCRWGSVVPIHTFLLPFLGVACSPLCGGWLLHGWSLLFCLFQLNSCGSFHWENWPRWHGIRPWGILSVLWGCSSDCSFRLLHKGLLLLGV